MLTAGSRVNGFTDTITIYRARKRLEINTNGMLIVAIETHRGIFLRTYGQLRFKAFFFELIIVFETWILSTTRGKLTSKKYNKINAVYFFYTPYI